MLLDLLLTEDGDIFEVPTCIVSGRYKGCNDSSTIFEGEVSQLRLGSYHIEQDGGVLQDAEGDPLGPLDCVDSGPTQVEFLASWNETIVDLQADGEIYSMNLTVVEDIIDVVEVDCSDEFLSFGTIVSVDVKENLQDLPPDVVEALEGAFIHAYNKRRSMMCDLPFRRVVDATVVQSKKSLTFVGIGAYTQEFHVTVECR